MLEQTIGSAENYTLPPPEDFDPLVATARDLRQRGFPKRPDGRHVPPDAGKWMTELRDYPSPGVRSPVARRQYTGLWLNGRSAIATSGQVAAS